MDNSYSVALTIPVPEELAYHSGNSLLDLEIAHEDLEEWEHKDLHEDFAAEVAIRGTIMKLLNEHLDQFGMPALKEYFDSPLTYIYDGIDEEEAEEDADLYLILQLEDSLRYSLHSAAVASGIRILH